jgi:hypothetical protein
MEIKWHNLIALVLFLLALVVLATQIEPISAALQTLGRIGPGHPPDQQAQGLVMTGLVIIGLLAALRIACASRDRES